MTSRKIIKHKLDSRKTLPYFLDHIKCGKTLSERIVEKVDFAKGTFSTILPCNAELERLLDFSHGGIIPPINYVQDSYSVKGWSEEFYPKKVITMDRECSELIADFLKRNNENWAVVENYMLDPDSHYIGIKNVRMVPFDSEVYYFLNQNNSTQEIYETIRKSSQVWHFLAVITRLRDALPPILTDEIMNQICENVKLVIAGAYDGEGYIFWKQ